MIKSNFHTHTYFCDGKDSPEEMVLSAIERGFTALGFSIHSYVAKKIDTLTPPENFEKYYKEITRLKEKYKDKIQIFCGIEQDYYSDEPTFPCDYKIGAVHYIVKGDQVIYIDRSFEHSKKNIFEIYKGDFNAYAKDYYALLEGEVEKTKPDFIAHFDLITKYNEKLNITLDDEYYEIAFKAVDKLVKYGLPFEINTGAIARGYRTTPYPDVKILERIYKKGGKIMINADCHNKDYLDYQFDMAKNLAKECGFTEYYLLTKDGMKAKKFN